MKRYGPLHATSTSLLLGDPGRRHLVLTPERLSYHNGREAGREFSWGEVEKLAFAVPTSRFRFPGAVSGVLSALLIAVVSDDPNIDLRDGVLEIRRGGVDERLPLSRHHFGGYWERTTHAAQRMLDRLVDDAGSRELLRHPQRLLEAVKASARR